MAQTATLLVDQGTTYRAVITFTQSGTTTPFDLTGCTAEMQIRPYYGAQVVYAHLTTGNGLTLGGTSGTITLVLTAAQTAAFPTQLPTLQAQQAQQNPNIPVGHAVFDIAITLPSGDIVRGLQGNVVTTAGVTLPAGSGSPQ